MNSLIKKVYFDNIYSNDNPNAKVSTYEYKDYVIVLRFFNGASYRIMKRFESRFKEIRKCTFNFNTPETLIEKATNYIDNYSKNLEDKYKRLVESKRKC